MIQDLYNSELNITFTCSDYYVWPLQLKFTVIRRFYQVLNEMYSISEHLKVIFWEEL